MQVGSINATPSSAAQDASNGGTTIDYNAFLQLLIAELKNQDPTKPTDPAEHIAQLAAFSNVEQAIKTNNKLDALMTSMAMAQADGLIGRTVVSADQSVSGEVAALRIVSGGAVAVLTDNRELPLGPGVTVF